MLPNKPQKILDLTRHGYPDPTATHLVKKLLNIKGLLEGKEDKKCEPE